MKDLELFKCLKAAPPRLLINNWYFAPNKSFAYKKILSISGWWFFRLSNTFHFPDPELPIIYILYGWSGICVQLGLRSLMFSFVTSK